MLRSNAAAVPRRRYLRGVFKRPDVAYNLVERADKCTAIGSCTRLVCDVVSSQRVDEHDGEHLTALLHKDADRLPFSPKASTQQPCPRPHQLSSSMSYVQVDLSQVRYSAIEGTHYFYDHRYPTAIQFLLSGKWESWHVAWVKEYVARLF